MKVVPSRKGYFPLLFLPLQGPFEPLDFWVLRKREFLDLAKLMAAAGGTNEEEEALSFLGALSPQVEGADLLLLLLDLTSYWKLESALGALGVG